VLEGWHLQAVECITFPAKFEEAPISPFNLIGEISSPAELLLCTTVVLQRLAACRPEWEEMAGSFQLHVMKRNSIPTFGLIVQFDVF
jgi:hypothetical protein